MKEWITRIGLIAFGFFIVVLSMLALEFWLSRFAPAPETYPVGFNERDKYIGWKGVPDIKKRYVYGRSTLYVERNSQGFRDRERSYEKEKGVFRIVVLGDSFTEALGVPLDQIFPQILEKRLNSESSVGSTTSLYSETKYRRFEVINLGITGFSTAQEYLTLKYYGLKYKPDLVILDFFIGNDVRENSYTLSVVDPSSRPYFLLSNGNLKEMPFEIKVGNPSEQNKEQKRTIDHFQILKSSLIRFFPNIYYSLNDRISEIPWLAHFLWEIGIKGTNLDLLDQSKLVKNQIESRVLTDFNVYAEGYSREWEEAWEITKALILKLANELKSQKIGFLVVVIPNEYEFRSDIWDKILGEYPQMRSIRFDLRKPERILSSFFEANRMEYLLLRPEFERYTKETGKDLHFYSAYENHWNANGHMLAADLIYKKLKWDKLVSIKDVQ